MIFFGNSLIQFNFIVSLSVSANVSGGGRVDPSSASRTDRTEFLHFSALLAETRRGPRSVRPFDVDGSGGGDVRARRFIEDVFWSR